MSGTKIRAYGVGKMLFHNVGASGAYSYRWALGLGYGEEKGSKEVGGVGSPAVPTFLSGKSRLESKAEGWEKKEWLRLH